MALRVHVVGSGDAFGSGGRFQACVRLSGAGRTLLVDCGATTLTALRGQGLDPGDVDAVLLTHLHGDHFAGLPFLVLDAQFRRRTRPLLVAGPRGVRERVEAAMEVLFPGSTGVRRRFETRYAELPGDLTPVQVGGATVRAAEVVHASGAPPLALRVTLGGRTVAFSGDTEWTDALLDVARDADLLICEAYTYGKKVRYHLDHATLRERLLPRLTARRLLLTHMSADMLGRLAEITEPVASDGLTLDL